MSTFDYNHIRLRHEAKQSDCWCNILRIQQNFQALEGLGRSVAVASGTPWFIGGFEMDLISQLGSLNWGFSWR